MLLGLWQPDLVAYEYSGQRSVTIATLPSFTKGGPPRSLTSLQTPDGQHLLIQLASFTKGRPTGMVVLSLQLSSNQDLGLGAAIAPSKLLYQGSTQFQRETMPSIMNVNSRRGQQ